MPRTIALSESAVAVLRFEIKGYRAKDQTRRLPAYRELAAAGIMEPVPGSKVEYRFTEEGFRRREAILNQEQERIKRERHAPPDTNISDAARELLRRAISSERIEVDEENRPVFRELAAARIVVLGHSFANGRESIYTFTYWGYKRRFELAGMEKA